MKQKPLRQVAAIAIIAAFVLLGVAFGVVTLLLGNLSRALLGFASVLFLLAPPLIKRAAGGHPWRLYSLCFAFCILAYDVGCVLQQFDAVPMLDKVSHFLSGFVFTTLGVCLFLLLRKNAPSPLGKPVAVAVSFGIFFSAFVAVLWEICEFMGYVLTGHDSQHHLTTGVFDTMGDLITCFVGSLLCGALLLPALTKGLRLPFGPTVKEFLGILKPGGAADAAEK